MKRWMLLAAFAIFSVTGTASAQVLTYSATTAGAPTWNRPVAETPPAPPTTLSTVGTATPFHAQPFYVTVAGDYTFQSTATSPVNWDNYTFLYSPAFNPATPLADVLIGNDDNITIGLSGFTFTLAANTQYFFINTGFGNSDEGDFTVDVSDIPGGSDGIFLGTIAVPEPTTIAFVASIGLGLVGYRYRSKFQRKKRLSTARR